MDKTIRLTDGNFGQEVLVSPIPVLVDFWASWCPPCKMTEPVVDKLAELFAGQIKVGKINVDRNPCVPQEYQVLGVPTFAVFKDGEIVARRTGAQSGGQLRALLAEVL